jgi:putative spermidine/putrescine transport system ATP-binding protein
VTASAAHSDGAAGEMTPPRERPPEQGRADRLPALAVAALEKRYGSVTALDRVSLDVRGGEFMTLLGPSGSGKTTLLNILAGFQQPDAGSVLLAGRDIGTTPAHRRGFGMVFQSYALFPHFTVEENVAYPLRMRHAPRAERVERVRETLRLVELDELAGRFPAELSGGQQQRVALARALVFRPEVLLMDEPLGALDRRLRQALQFEIKRLHAELGMTVVYVTHDQEEALSMSDRITVMSRGRIEQVDAPRDVYQRPATEFVAAFLGETNFLDVEVQAVGGMREVRHVATRRLVERSASAPLGRGRLSIRPEHLRVVPAAEGGDGLVGRVEQRTFMGDHWRCECRIGDDTVIACVPIREPYAPEPGELAGLDPIEGLSKVFAGGSPRGSGGARDAAAERVERGDGRPAPGAGPGMAPRRPT